jgi:hypothetical protein
MVFLKSAVGTYTDQRVNWTTMQNNAALQSELQRQGNTVSKSVCFEQTETISNTALQSELQRQSNTVSKSVCIYKEREPLDTLGFQVCWRLCSSSA